MIYFIPHEILERKLRNKVRIRKQKEIIVKYIDLAKVRSSSQQSQPLYQTELTYKPTTKKESGKIICNYCGSENKKTSNFCVNCGNQLG